MDICYINTTYFIFQFIDEFFFFLTIFNNSMFFILDGFFLDDNIDQ